MNAETGQELEVREAKESAALVKPIPVPRELQELGLRIGADESGMRVVFLPDALRKNCNVVNPTTSFTQADANWTPGVSIVKLDVDRDTYPLPGGKKGLSKQALETLSKAAGVLYTRTERVPREELQIGELWAYRATVGFRRSDGTIDEVTRERGFNAEAERGEIEDSVAKSDKFNTDEKRAAEIRKRWLAELKFGPAKTESKAINRALRAGLSIPTSVTATEAAKPFLVIGYNFTPDYDDPAVKRAIVDVALNAQAAIYGGREVSDQMPELEAGDIPAESVTPESEAPAESDVGDTGDDAREQAASEPSDATAPAAADTDEPAGGSSSEREPEPELDGPAIKVPKAAIDAAGEVTARGDKTVADVVTAAASGDKKSRDWLLWAVRNLEESESAEDTDDRLASIRLFASEQTPELWAELVAEAAGE